MKNKLPTTQPKGQGESLVPAFNPSNLASLDSVIPKFTSGNRNIAGTVTTTVHLKNARGEEMNITQTQQVLNLSNQAKGKWTVGGNPNKQSGKYRKKKYQG